MEIEQSWDLSTRHSYFLFFLLNWLFIFRLGQYVSPSKWVSAVIFTSAPASGTTAIELHLRVLLNLDRNFSGQHAFSLLKVPFLQIPHGLPCKRWSGEKDRVQFKC